MSNTEPFEAGQVVMVKWNETLGLYPATLVKEIPDKEAWNIQWHDNYKHQTVQSVKNLRHLKIGDSVVALYRNPKSQYHLKYFRASITKILETGLNFEIGWCDSDKYDKTNRDGRDFQKCVVFQRAAYNKDHLLNHRCDDFSKFFVLEENVCEWVAGSEVTDLVKAIDAVIEEKTGARARNLATPNRTVLKYIALSRVFGRAFTRHARDFMECSDFEFDPRFKESARILSDVELQGSLKSVCGASAPKLAKTPSRASAATESPESEEEEGAGKRAPSFPTLKTNQTTEGVEDPEQLWDSLPPGSYVTVRDIDPANGTITDIQGYIGKRLWRTTQSGSGVEFRLYNEDMEYMPFRLPRDNYRKVVTVLQDARDVKTAGRLKREYEESCDPRRIREAYSL